MVRKTYEALVFGDAGRGRRTWRDKLRTEKGEGRAGARTSVGSGDMSEAQASVLKRGEARNGQPLTLLSLEPATGRTHQLRVQCASRYLPIVGDATYGNFAWNKKAAKELGIKRLCLHAAAISLSLEHEGRKISFTANCPTPEIFREAIGG
jgi:23S rRNA-/tRNA-specific pseudouridylate synthase